MGRGGSLKKNPPRSPWGPFKRVKLKTGGGKMKREDVSANNCQKMGGRNTRKTTLLGKENDGTTCWGRRPGQGFQGEPTQTEERRNRVSLN